MGKVIIYPIHSQYLHIFPQVELSDVDAELTDPNLDHRH